VPPAEAYGVASFYAMFSTTPQPKQVVHVCDDIACMPNGADELCAQLESRLGPEGDPATEEGTTWHRSPCLGLCDNAPAVLFVGAGEAPATWSHAPATADDVLQLIAGQTLRVIRTVEAPQADDLFGFVPPPEADPADIGSWTPDPRVDERFRRVRLLKRVGGVDPTSLESYEDAGGYAALRRAVERGPRAVIEEVKAAKLLGRGGAAFPTGVKWEAVAGQSQRPHYLVCNADESEPGTFKDRVLMEQDPFAVVEAMTIAAFAAGCERGYVYIRGEYPLATERLTDAIGQARAKGYLGDDVAGAGFAFDVEVRRGAGAYICGEETALFNSIEGKRGEPRNKPPFPVTHGLFGKPTVVNNVETLVNVLDIVLEGGEAYARIGTPESTGTRLFCLSGCVERPGLYEVEFGATLRELLDLAGARSPLKAVLLGGAAGSFVTPDDLDLPLTFEATRAAGTSLGSGVIMAFDDTVDLAGILLRIARFFRDESCGQCVPCRVGTVRQEELLRRLVTGRTFGSVQDELALLNEIGRAMRDASICGLGQTAANAIESAIARFDLLDGSPAR
jgi:NADH-quinone oxidoreductase subunit F